jgi:hypothetical protein
MSAALSGLDVSAMRSLFAVPWITPHRPMVLSLVLALILVFSVFALLKTNSRGKQAPSEELITGSIQRSSPVGKSQSNDPMASLLAPVLSQPSPQLVQSKALDRANIAATATKTPRQEYRAERYSNSSGRGSGMKSSRLGICTRVRIWASRTKALSMTLPSARM